MKIFHRLWNDETGFIVASELVLIATILVIGLIVGLASLRNQVVQELVSMGQAVGALDQSYAFSGTQCTAGQTNGSAMAWNNAIQSWSNGNQNTGAITMYNWSQSGLQ
jgi:hypothetical protein